MVISSRILIAHDDFEFKNRLKSYLEKCGFLNIRTVSDIDSLREACTNGDYVLVIAKSSVVKYSDVWFVNNEGCIRSQSSPRTEFILLTEGTQDEERIDLRLVKSTYRIRTTADFEYITTVIKHILRKQMPLEQETVPEQNLEYTDIYETLDALGIQKNQRVYGYLCSALKLALEDSKRLEMITKLIYPEVARKYKTTSSAVERAIRIAVEEVWSNIDKEVICRYSYSVKDNSKIAEKPSNRQFLSLVTNGIRLQRNT